MIVIYCIKIIYVLIQNDYRIAIILGYTYLLVLSLAKTKLREKKRERKLVNWELLLKNKKEN